MNPGRCMIAGVMCLCMALITAWRFHKTKDVNYAFMTIAVTLVGLFFSWSGVFTYILGE